MDPTCTLRKPRSTKVPRLSGSPASARLGNRSHSAPSDSTSSIRASGAPRQKCSAGAEGEVRVGVAVGVEPVGLGERRRVAVGRPQQRGDLLALLDHDSPDLDVRGRGALEELQCRVEAQHLLDRQGRVGTADAGPGASSATSPLPNTLTEASWPALSSSTTAATSSSSVSPVAEEVGDQVVARLGATAIEVLAHVVGELGRGEDSGVDDLAGRAAARTSARSPATSRRRDGYVGRGQRRAARR